MKQMFFTDYATIKGILWQQVLLSIGVTLFVVFFVGNPFMVVPMIAVMIPLYSIITLIAYDERNGWERYRLTLPLSRSHTVLGRYAFILALTLISIVIGLIIHGILLLGTPLWSMLPLKEQFVEMLVETDAQSLLAVAISPLLIVLFITSFVLPLAFRLGMSKTVQWIPLVIIFLFVGGGAALQYTTPDFLVEFFEWVAVPQNTALLLGIGTGIGCLLYAGSAVLATRLYKAREL